MVPFLVAIDTGWYPILGISLVSFLFHIGTALFRPRLFSPTEMHFSYSLFRGRSLMCPINSMRTSLNPTFALPSLDIMLTYSSMGPK